MKSDKIRLLLPVRALDMKFRCPVSVAQSLPGSGRRVKIYTYTYVREDALGLFGFLTRDDLTVLNC